MAEDVEPGSYLQPQDEEVPKDKEGVGFSGTATTLIRLSED